MEHRKFTNPGAGHHPAGGARAARYGLHVHSHDGHATNAAVLSILPPYVTIVMFYDNRFI
jgi:hypothetical protein